MRAACDPKSNISVVQSAFFSADSILSTLTVCLVGSIFMYIAASIFLVVFSIIAVDTVVAQTPSCSPPRIGHYFGEKDELVMVGIHVHSPLEMNFVMYLQGLNDPESLDPTDCRMVFTIPRLGYSFDQTDCGLTLSGIPDSTGEVAKQLVFGDLTPQSFTLIDSMYGHIKSKFPAAMVAALFPAKFGGEMLADGQIKLMGLLDVTWSQSPTDLTPRMQELAKRDKWNITADDQQFILQHVVPRRTDASAATSPVWLVSVVLALTAVATMI